MHSRHYYLAACRTAGCTDVLLKTDNIPLSLGLDYTDLKIFFFLSLNNGKVVSQPLNASRNSSWPLMSLKVCCLSLSVIIYWEFCPFQVSESRQLCWVMSVVIKINKLVHIFSQNDNRLGGVALTVLWLFGS